MDRRFYDKIVEEAENRFPNKIERLPVGLGVLPGKNIEPNIQDVVSDQANFADELGEVVSLLPACSPMLAGISRSLVANRRHVRPLEKRTQFLAKLGQMVEQLAIR